MILVATFELPRGSENTLHGLLLGLVDGGELGVSCNRDTPSQKKVESRVSCRWYTRLVWKGRVEKSKGNFRSSKTKGSLNKEKVDIIRPEIENRILKLHCETLFRA